MRATNTRTKRFNPESSEINVKTFRYEFGEQFMNALRDFANIHRFDERKQFKAAWNMWSSEEDIREQIDAEVKRLNDEGYVGDVLDKMFKSARYYFRKQPLEKGPEKKERKPYISLSPVFLEKIDIHIFELFKTNSHINHETQKRVSKITPAAAYDDFCKNNTDIIREQIKCLINSLDDDDEICLKLKKTFKNRFHVLKATIC